MECPAPFRIPEAAKEGFSDGGVYDVYRATYPRAVVDSFLDKIKVKGRGRARIVEVGAGTGKFTERLVERPEKYEVVAVEPLAGMRAQLADKELGAGRVKLVDGHAGGIPLEEGWGDAAVVAQAFHWFADEGALEEIARVLRPMAVLGMIWNVEDLEITRWVFITYNSLPNRKLGRTWVTDNKPRDWQASTKWEQKLNDMVHSLPDDGHPRFRHSKWPDVFTSQLASSPLQALRGGASGKTPRFSLPLGEERVPFSIWLSEDELWRRMCTLSQMSIIVKKGGDEARELRTKFDEALRGDDVERNDKGEVNINGQTYFAWTDKIGGYY
ncbi:hypothetical protein PoMZ_05557 [Pyricularia oryzae]|uniref:Methyltransferase type 11 domain-containing protein n=1 Tax=Pyricularia oryzae TaxID=318829 RepID=A0A4P7NQ41_PYROR|nr:methyltransferase [Pyricularia oryzae]QBZ63866.1 hypothetical protein PoMZ_05557 [Pyricularia oryzae]